MRSQASTRTRFPERERGLLAVSADFAPFATGHYLALEFNAPMLDFPATPLGLVNTTSGETIPWESLAVTAQPSAPGGALYHITFPGLDGGLLPPGLYQFELPAGSVTDIADNTLENDYLFSFSTLPGDYDVDGYVSTADYLVWKQHYSGSGTAALQADGNADGQVNANDYSIWRNNLGATLFVNVAGLIASGEATYAATSWDIGHPLNLFDGDLQGLYRSQNINPASVTLAFDDPQQVVGFRTYMNGDTSRWRVKGANSLADLESQSGSSALLVADTVTPSDVFSTMHLAGAAIATHFRLTVERLAGDNFVHINSCDFIGAAAGASIAGADTEGDNADATGLSWYPETTPAGRGALAHGREVVRSLDEGPSSDLGADRVRPLLLLEGGSHRATRESKFAPPRRAEFRDSAWEMSIDTALASLAGEAAEPSISAPWRY